MPKSDSAMTTAEHKIEEFAEDLGRLLGTAQAKAEGWLDQRQQIAKTLTQLRDTASNLLGQITGAGAGAASAGRKRGPGRPKGSGTRKRRKMSAEAREKIRQAQLKRWAKFKAAKKK